MSPPHSSFHLEDASESSSETDEEMAKDDHSLSNSSVGIPLEFDYDIIEQRWLPAPPSLNALRMGYVRIAGVGFFWATWVHNSFNVEPN